METMMVLVVVAAVVAVITSNLVVKMTTKSPNILGRPVKHRHFYASVQKYIGGYLQIDTFGDHGLFEKIGQIKSIELITYNGRDELRVQCAWSLEREFGPESRWEPCSYDLSNEYDCFNSLYDEHIELDAASIQSYGDGCLIITPGSSRTFKLIIPLSVSSDIDWYKNFSQLKQLG